MLCHVVYASLLQFGVETATHKVEGVEDAIEARGARAVFLPAYSPDLNPIEQLFARLKAFLRKMKARTVEELWRDASFLKGVSKEECKAYLANSGYTGPNREML